MAPDRGTRLGGGFYLRNFFALPGSRFHLHKRSATDKLSRKMSDMLKLFSRCARPSLKKFSRKMIGDDLTENGDFQRKKIRSHGNRNFTIFNFLSFASGRCFFFVEAILTKLAIQKGENWSLRFFMGRSKEDCPCSEEDSKLRGKKRISSIDIFSFCMVRSYRK